MAAFSGAVKIGDLNDFIAPSQACVVSLEGGKLAGAAADAEASGAVCDTSRAWGQSKGATSSTANSTAV